MTRHTSVGDDEAVLAAIFKEIGERADVAVVTGGLGPTEDDLTSIAAAAAAGVPCEAAPLGSRGNRAFF